MNWIRAARASIRLRMMLAAALALVAGIVLVTGWMVDAAEKELLQGQRERELREAVRASQLVSRRTLELQRALQAAGRLLDEKTLSNPAALADFMRTQPVLQSQFAILFAAGADGRMRVYADSQGIRNPGLDVSQRAYFKRVTALRAPVISDPLLGGVSREPVVLFAQPLLGPGGLYGVLGGGFRLTSRDLLSDLVDGIDQERPAGLAVTDGKGQLLAHPERRLILEPLSADPRFAAALARSQSIGAPVEPAGVLLEFEDHAVAAAGVPGADWIVWRHLPDAEMLAPLEEARRSIHARAAVLVTLLTVVLLVLLHVLLRPLRDLERRAARMFESGLAPSEGWPRHGGEIGHLAQVLRRVGTERAALEEQNRDVMTKLRSVLTAAPLGVAFVKQGRFELANAHLCALLGEPPDALLGQPLERMFATRQDHARCREELDAACAAGSVYSAEWELQRDDGSRFWAALRAAPVDDGPQGSRGLILTLIDISEQVASRRQLEWSAAHDRLTGLANREVFDHRITRLCQALPLSMPAALIVLDLDRFKPINDTHGHLAGDAMLKAVAQALAATVLATDLVARLGGDEFAVLLERCSLDAARRVAEALQAAVAELSLEWNQDRLRLSCSIGVAALDETMGKPEDWYRAADTACYVAKSAGRACVVHAP